jgi:hypothetical protein
VSALRDAAEEYLRMRRLLGYKLKRQGHQLLEFVGYLEQAGGEYGDDRARRRVGDVRRHRRDLLG